MMLLIFVGFLLEHPAKKNIFLDIHYTSTNTEFHKADLCFLVEILFKEPDLVPYH